SSRFIVPNYWADPKSGIGYQVQVEVPRALLRQPHGMEGVGSLEDLKAIPLKQASGAAGTNQPPLLLRDVAEITRGTMPGQYDRYNMKRQIGITANIHGADLGSVSREVAAALKRAGDPPPDTSVQVLG